MNAKGKFDFNRDEFALKSIAVSNQGDVYMGLFTPNENCKSNDKSSLELLLNSKEGEQKYTFPINDMFYRDVSIKVVRDGNIFLAALVAPKKNSYPTHIKTMIIDPVSFELVSSDIAEINVVKKEISTSSFNYYRLKILNIIQMQDDKILINCEQYFDELSSGGLSQLRGPIVMVYSDIDAKIKGAE